MPTSPSPSSASPPPGLTGRCPTLIASSPSFLSTNPVLHAIGPFGLPSLPYHSPAAAYAYPLLVHEDYVAQYDPRTRNANWVIELLTPAPPPSPPSFPSSSLPSHSPPSPPPSPSRSLSTFLPDPALLPFPTPSLPSHFPSSSYDRGHLVPAADVRRSSQSSLNSTFLLTNISPQSPPFNRRYLAAVEAWIRSLTRTYRRVMVITGPLWLPRGKERGEGGREREVVRYEVIPRGRPVVAVPTHFFKLLLASQAGEEGAGGAGGAEGEEGEGEVVVLGLVLPNDEVKGEVELLSFVSSVAAIEEATGWLLFPQRGGQLRAGSMRGKGEAGSNIIDVSDLSLEVQGIHLQPGLGLSEAEKRSVARLCKRGGCDLTPFVQQMKRWAKRPNSRGQAQAAGEDRSGASAAGDAGLELQSASGPDPPSPPLPSPP